MVGATLGELAAEGEVRVVGLMAVMVVAARVVAWKAAEAIEMGWALEGILQPRLSRYTQCP